MGGTMLNEIQKGLSPRQKSVLEELSQGLSNKQISYKLGFAEATIKMHLSVLLRFFKAQNRVQILLNAAQQGFIVKKNNKSA